MSKKFINIIIVFLCLFSYFPVNRLLTGVGYDLQSPLDKQIQLVPIFIVPYLLAPMFWLGFVIWSNLKLKGIKLKTANFYMALAGLISTVIYILLPTYVIRPEVTGTDLFSELIKLLYSNDNVYNAAPSGHTFYTLLIFLFLYKEKSKWAIPFGIYTFIVMLSTLFTKQHNIADVVTGVLFAYAIKSGVDIYIKQSAK